MSVFNLRLVLPLESGSFGRCAMWGPALLAHFLFPVRGPLQHSCDTVWSPWGSGLILQIVFWFTSYLSVIHLLLCAAAARSSHLLQPSPLLLLYTVFNFASVVVLPTCRYVFASLRVVHVSSPCIALDLRFWLCLPWMGSLPAPLVHWLTQPSGYLLRLWARFARLNCSALLSWPGHM